ncbi:MAG: N-6 DNA methylase [Planctomycetota bacterium]|nr:N-6 DNA methylase [Planctomycetota bacterium]
MPQEKAKKKNKHGFNANTDHRRQEVQQAVKSACDQLRADGVDPRNYVEQLAWLFFLKAFDEMESRLEEEASFDGTAFRRRLDDEYRWSNWSSMTNRPDQMLEFVDGKLLPHLKAFGETQDTVQFANDPVAERFRRIFSTVRNHSRRGASFARVAQQVDRLHFGDATDGIVLSEIYEGLLKDVAADSAGYAGEFYTQRHIIRAMVEVVRPKIGERVYDPCFGTAGFLGESAEYIRNTAGALSSRHLDRLQRETFYGIEIKPLTYLLGTMNMLLHRIEGAGLELGNTLELHSSYVPEKDRYDVILSNPPYGGKMARELQTNFTIHSGSTEILFLQHIMTNLAKGGRAAVIIPEGVLFRGGPDAKVRERLLREFDVHTILSLPTGCFLPYTSVKTNVLFFTRRKDSRGTKDVWYYELTNDGFDLKSTRRPIDGNQIPDFLSKWEKRAKGGNSWRVPIKDIEERDWDLSAQNPTKVEDLEHKPVLELVQSIKAKEERIVELLGELEDLVEAPE